MRIDRHSFCSEIHNTTQQCSYSTRENYITVTGKDADSAGTDSRITWLQGVYRGSIWHYPIHYCLTADGYVTRGSIQGEKSNDWLADLEPLNASCQVFNTDSDNTDNMMCAGRGKYMWQALHHTATTSPLLQSSLYETTMVFKHSVVFSILIYNLQRRLLEKKILSLVQTYSIYTPYHHQL